MNNVVFGKTMGNVIKCRDVKLVTTERRRHYLVPEPIYHTTKFSTEHLLETKMEKAEILMNNLVYLRIS